MKLPSLTAASSVAITCECTLWSPLLSAYVLARLSRRTLLIDHPGLQRAYDGEPFEPWQCSMPPELVRHVRNATVLTINQITMSEAWASPEAKYLMETDLAADPTRVLAVATSLWFAPLLYNSRHHRAELRRMLDLTGAPPARHRAFGRLARELFVPSDELARRIAAALAPLGGGCDAGLHVRITVNTFAEAHGLCASRGLKLCDTPGPLGVESSLAMVSSSIAARKWASSAAASSSCGQTIVGVSGPSSARAAAHAPWPSSAVGTAAVHRNSSIFDLERRAVRCY